MDIGFLQETHLKDQHHKRLKTKWIGQVYHSNFPVKNRGAAIIIKKSIPFSASKVIADPRGRYVIVSAKKCHFFAALPNMDSHQLIIGGDFNLVLDQRNHVTYLNPLKPFIDSWILINCLILSDLCHLTQKSTHISLSSSPFFFRNWLLFKRLCILNKYQTLRLRSNCPVWPLSSITPYKDRSHSNNQEMEV